MTHPVLQKTIYLKADSDTVWDYLTQPDRLAEWFQKPSAPLVEGGVRLRCLAATAVTA